MLLTWFCEIQEAQATLRIQFGLLTAKIKHNRTQKQTPLKQQQTKRHTTKSQALTLSRTRPGTKHSRSTPHTGTGAVAFNKFSPVSLPAEYR